MASHDVDLNDSSADFGSQTDLDGDVDAAEANSAGSEHEAEHVDKIISGESSGLKRKFPSEVAERADADTETRWEALIAEQLHAWDKGVARKVLEEIKHFPASPEMPCPPGSEVSSTVLKIPSALRRSLGLTSLPRGREHYVEDPISVFAAFNILKIL